MAQIEDTKQFKVGIIVNGYNYTDIAIYKNQFIELQKSIPAIEFILIGYVPSDDDFNLIDRENQLYTNPVSIIHYFKHLNQLKLDLLFIPLEDSYFNQSSENFNKFAELAMLNIPTIAKRQYPYSKLIRNQICGFVFEHTNYFTNLLIEIYNTPNRETILLNCATSAHELVKTNISYSEKTIGRLINAFD